MSNQNQQTQETEPLLSASQVTIDSALAHTALASCEQQDSSKGFTLRRCMIFPVSFCYFLSGGILMYELPQYTQQVMKEKYQHQKLTSPSLPLMSDKLHESGYVDFMSVIPFAPPVPFMPISPVVIETDACRTVNESDPAYSQFTKVQQETAMWTIYFAVSLYIPAMFANLIWSSYSDIFGRRFAFLLCLVGNAIRMVVLALIVYFKWSLLIFIGLNIIDGLTGSFTSFLAVSFSFVSDITHSGKHRTLAIVVYELMLGLTISLASFGMGYFIKYTGFLYPAITSGGLAVLSIVMFILVPETLQNRSARRQSLNMCSKISESVKFYFCEGTKVQRVKYILLLLGFLFNGIPSMSRGTLEVLYQLGRPFCWSSTKIGWFGAVKTVSASLFGIIGAFVFKQCLADDTIAMWSLALGSVSYLVEGLATTDLVLYMVPVIAAPTGLPFPMIRSLMSSLTPADKQGAMFASVGFVETLCTLIGSVCNNIVYSATLTIMNGFVFLLLAALMFTASFFLLAFVIVHRRYKDETGRNVHTILVNASGSVSSVLG